MIRSAAGLALLLAGPALAQTAPPPYAGLQVRAVKALSEQQVADLKAGRGMGMALPAELNGYPGPMHTLEQADALALTPEQRTRTESLFEAMRTEVVPLGERLIREEMELERLFASGTVETASLEAATTAIGTTQGQLRAAHLRYHLAMADVLTPEQVDRHGQLRRYGDPGATGHHGGPGQSGHGAHKRSCSCAWQRADRRDAVAGRVVAARSIRGDPTATAGALTPHTRRLRPL